jgi:hypothetical protein
LGTGDFGARARVGNAPNCEVGLISLKSEKGSLLSCRDGGERRCQRRRGIQRSNQRGMVNDGVRGDELVGIKVVEGSKMLWRLPRVSEYGGRVRRCVERKG